MHVRLTPLNGPLFRGLAPISTYTTGIVASGFNGHGRLGSNLIDTELATKLPPTVCAARTGGAGRNTARTVDPLGSDGATAMAPTAEVRKKPSETFSHVVPPSVVFPTPPAQAPK